MDDVLLLSRSDDKTLLNFTSQEEYFDLILNTHNDSKMLKIRKLREGILASKRRDAFALRVYETAVDECLASSNYNELVLSLMGLMKLYKALPHLASKSRRDEITCYYLLYFTSKDTKEAVFLLKGLDSNLLDGDRVRLALDWIKAMSNLNYFKLTILYSKLTNNEKLIIHPSLPLLRPQIVGIMSKTYFTLPLDYLLLNLMLKDDTNARAIVQDLIPFPMDADGTVELKRRRK